MSRPKMPGVGRGNGRPTYVTSHITKCKLGLSGQRVPWKLFGWTDEQVCEMFELIHSMPVRPKPKVIGPGRGGHNRIGYSHSKLTAAKISAGRNKVNWFSMTNKELLSWYDEFCRPVKCLTPSCNNIVKCATETRVYCTHCCKLGDKNISKRSDVRAKIKNKVSNYYRTASKEKLDQHRKNISKACFGKRDSDSTRKKKRAASKKYWEEASPEKKKAHLKKTAISCGTVRPNRAEQHIQSLLDGLFPNQYKYVGDGDVWFGRKNPDFININGQKKIIELFGEHWHKAEDVKNRTTHFAKFGYDCCVIWSKEIKDTCSLSAKLCEFHNKV